MSESLPQLLMRHPTLEGLGAPSAPNGYVLRPFRDGDEEGWCRVMDLAFGWEPGRADFDQMMRRDPCYAPDRVKLAVAANGTVAATASCWIDPKHGPDVRWLHWVATHPDHAGRGLGYQVSLVALHHARAEDCTAALLLTEEAERVSVAPALGGATLRVRW